MSHSFLSDLPSKHGIADRFHAVCKAFPQKAAVFEKGRVVTYEELENKALRVKSFLSSRALSPGNRVAFSFSSTTDSLAAMLGILEAQCMYVPIDPTQGAERHDLIFNKLSPAFILCDNPSIFEVTPCITPPHFISPQEIYTTEIGRGSAPTACSARALASLLLTSGSTGIPKAVQQSQENLLFHVNELTKQFTITENDVHSLIAPFIFDASTMDIFCTILNGATLSRISSIDLRNNMFGEIVEKSKVSILHTTPTLFRHLCRSSLKKGALSSLRLVVLGGEPVFYRDYEMFKGLFPDKCRFLNGYGATETSGFVALFDPEGTHEKTSSLMPIGREPAGFSITLARNGEDKKSEEGELCITSRHISLGYWKDPNSTSFKENADGTRTYCTGDWGRTTEKGDYVLSGRKDLQVKVRGYRIDLGELDRVFLTYQGISQAVTMVSETGDRIEALISIDHNTGVDITELHTYLATAVPLYVLPISIFVIEALPLTITGKTDRLAAQKIDRKLLPRLVKKSLDDEKLSSTELLVTSVCCEILGLTSVSVSDCFFDIGGDSLSLSRLHALLESKLQRNIPIGYIYSFPTLKLLCDFLDGTKKDILSTHIMEIMSRVQRRSRSKYRDEA